MKKIILLFLLFSSILLADAKIYLGLSYGIAEEDFTTADATSSSAVINLKAGYGIREAYAVEIDLEYLKNESKIFSSGTQNDGDKYSLNISLVKAFDLDIYILPFVKAGFGAGYMKIDRTLQTELGFGSFHLGTGVYIPIGDNFDFELGYRYKYVSYEGLDLIASNVDHASQTQTPYFGLNIRY